MKFPKCPTITALVLLCSLVLGQDINIGMPPINIDGNSVVARSPTPEPPVVVPLPPKVVDLAGDPLKSGKSYRIMFGFKAGVGFAQKNDNCPLYAAQQATNAGTATETPLELVFHILLRDNAFLLQVVETKDKDTVFEGEVIAIEFKSNPNLGCKESLVWQVIDDEVRTGGPSVVEGIEVSTSSKFQITKADFPDNRVTPIYKLQYCPSDDESCQDIAKRIDPITTRPQLVVDNSNQNPFYRVQ